MLGGLSTTSSLPWRLKKPFYSHHKDINWWRLEEIRNVKPITRETELHSQGKVMECVAVDKASSHVLRTGQYTRFAAWRFINKARLNLLPLNANRQDPGNKACRLCGYEKENLPHVINHCMRYSQLYRRRHNVVDNRVKKAAQSKYTVLAEN